MVPPSCLAQHVYIKKTPMKTTKHSGAQSEDFGRPRCTSRRLTLPLVTTELSGARLDQIARAGSILKAYPSAPRVPPSSIHVDRAHAIPHPLVLFIIAVSEVRRVRLNIPPDSHRAEPTVVREQDCSS